MFVAHHHHHHHHLELVGDVAVSTSVCQAVLFYARRWAVARPRFSGRRSFSIVRNQVCLGPPGLLLQCLGRPVVLAYSAWEWSWLGSALQMSNCNRTVIESQSNRTVVTVALQRQKCFHGHPQRAHWRHALRRVFPHPPSSSIASHDVVWSIFRSAVFIPCRIWCRMLMSRSSSSDVCMQWVVSSRALAVNYASGSFSNGFKQHSIDLCAALAAGLAFSYDINIQWMGRGLHRKQARTMIRMRRLSNELNTM